jgi:hypothetical protein
MSIAISSETKSANTGRAKKADRMHANKKLQMCFTLCKDTILNIILLCFSKLQTNTSVDGNLSGSRVCSTRLACPVKWEGYLTGVGGVKRPAIQAGFENPPKAVEDSPVEKSSILQRGGSSTCIKISKLITGMPPLLQNGIALLFTGGQL